MKRKKNYEKNIKGFTIVELVIVIAVIAILAAVLIPTFSNVIDNANEVANLQEARNTMQAYNAFITEEHKGQSMPDGVVFKVEKTGTTYVYYKNELHKFKGEPISEFNGVKGKEKFDTITTPLSKINDDYVLLDHAFTTFADTDNPIPVTDTGKKVYFFYNTDKFVQFEDGSAKCHVYPGVVLQIETGNIEDEQGKLQAAIESAKIKQGYAISLGPGLESEFELLTYALDNETTTLTVKVKNTKGNTYNTFEAKSGETVLKVADPTTDDNVTTLTITYPVNADSGAELQLIPGAVVISASK